jgi:hypothetical protein
MAGTYDKGVLRAITMPWPAETDQGDRRHCTPRRAERAGRPRSKVTSTGNTIHSDKRSWKPVVPEPQ